MTLMNSLGTEMITILYANNCCAYLSSNVEHCKSKGSNCFLSHDGGQRLCQILVPYSLSDADGSKIY